MKANDVHSIRDLAKHIESAIYRGADEFRIPKPLFLSPSEFTIHDSYGNDMSYTKYIATGSRVEICERPFPGSPKESSRGSFPCTLTDLSRIVALADKRARIRCMEDDETDALAGQDEAEDFSYFMSLNGSQLQDCSEARLLLEFRNWQKGSTI